MRMRKILVVDDQPGIRLLLHDILLNEGYHVATAKTGKEGLEKIRSGTFDLIMLDYLLPIVSGSEFLQQLEQDNISIPVILMSGMAENIKKLPEKHANIADILTKPFNIADVCKMAHMILCSDKVV